MADVSDKDVPHAISPLKLAVLLNGFKSSNTPAVRKAFETAITSAANLRSISRPTINFYDPIVAQIHPDPEAYDLIVLSGGTADPMGSDPWILKLQTYLRATVQLHPKQKIVGICWGHQTVAVTFGGVVGDIDAEIGVTPIELTPKGRSMFHFASDTSIRLHEFHAREVKTAAKRFIALAGGNQVFVNEANTILTFQGHPELNAELARKFVENTPVYMGVAEGRKQDLIDKAGVEHDGVKVWARILEWARE